MRIFSLFLISAFVLTGCSQATVESSMNEEATEQSEQQESSDTNTPNEDSAEELAPDALPDIESNEYVTVETIEDADIIVARTFDKFIKGGIVESYVDAGLVMVHNPDQRDQYKAALISTADNTAELIFDTRDFTSAWPFFVLSDPEYRANAFFGSHPAGFTIEYEDPSFGRYGYNYLTDGEKLVGSWYYPDPDNEEIVALVTYNYEVDQKWIDRLDVAVDDFLAEDSAE